MIAERRIITFGLTDEENNIVLANKPTSDYEIFDTDAPTDLIAIGSIITIIRASELDEDSLGMLFDYHTQLDGCFDETVIWIGSPEPPKNLKKIFKCYPSFEDISDNLKYILLTAHRQSKNASDYSEKFVIGLKIIKSIKQNPGIRSKELAEIAGISLRSVQRYITALQVAGEFIEYDPSKKGWILLDGRSEFLGDWDR